MEQQSYEVVKQLTPEEQIYLYDTQMAKSAYVESDKVHTEKLVFMPQNLQSGYISTKLPTTVQTTLPKATSNNVPTNVAVQINVGSDKIYQTANMYLLMQADLFMQSTVGAELNPATSIFGKVYNVGLGARWKKRSYRTVEEKVFSVSATVTPASKNTNSAAVYTVFKINGFQLTGTPTLINGLWFSQTSDVITINGVALTNGGVYIYGKQIIQITGTNQLLVNGVAVINPGITSTFDTITAAGLVQTVGVSGNMILNVPVSKNSTQSTVGFGLTTKGPNMTSQQTSEVTCAPFILNPTGLMQTATFICGEQREEVSNVNYRGVPEQREISSEVQRNNFPFTFYDYDEDTFNFCLDTRWKNYTVSTTNTNTYIETLASTNADGTPCLNVGATGFTASMANANGYDAINPLGLFGSAATGTNTANMQQYAQAGWCYVQQGANQSVNDILLFKKQVNLLLPLNFLFRTLQNQEWLAPALKDNAANVMIQFLRQTNLGNMLGGNYQQGNSCGQVTNYSTNVTSWTTQLPFLDPTYTGMTKFQIICNSTTGVKRTMALNSMPVVHQNVSQLEVIQQTQPQILGGMVGTVYIPTSHKSVKELEVIPIAVDTPQYGFSMYWQRGNSIVNCCQFCDIWNAMPQGVLNPIANELLWPARQNFQFGGTNIINQEMTSMIEAITMDREAHNITSHYKYSSGFGDFVKFWLTYGLSMNMNCEQDNLLGKLNIINDGYTTLTNKLAFVFQIYNYFQNGVFDLQDIGAELNLLSASNTLQYMPSYQSSQSGQQMQLLYRIKYDLNLYYQPQNGKVIITEEAIGEM